MRTLTIGHLQDIMATSRDIRMATKTIPKGGLTPKSIKLRLVVSAIQSTWPCLTC